MKGQAQKISVDFRRGNGKKGGITMNARVQSANTFHGHVMVRHGPFGTAGIPIPTCKNLLEIV